MFRVYSRSVRAFLRLALVAALFFAVLAMPKGAVAQAIPSLALGLVTCQTTAVPPVIRAEGIAEIVADIVLVCQNSGNALGDPTRNRIVTNVSVSLNVNVTNNINFGEGSNVTDAVLIVNENNCVDPAPAGSTFGDCVTPDVRFQDPQLGTLAASNRLEWSNVDFPVPGASASGAPVADCSGGGTTFPGELTGGCFPFVTTLRITSMRANTSQLGIPNAATFPTTQVTAFVSITGPTTIPTTNNVLNVAVPVLGLVASYPEPLAGRQCVDGGDVLAITLREGFATAFKTQGFPTFFPSNTQYESGYFSPGSNNGAGASQGSRLVLRFFNIPQGVMLTVSKVVETGNAAIPQDALRFQWVGGVGADGAGGVVSSDTDELVIDSPESGSASVVYEVVDGNPFLIEEAAIPVIAHWTADAGNGLPGIGTIQVSATLGPVSSVSTADLNAAESRFVDAGSDPQTIFSISPCSDSLLFSSVTNQEGADTRIVIDNLSGDSDGACTLHYHGETTGGGAPPADQTSLLISPGGQFDMTLSGGSTSQGIAGAPEFAGYVIADCDFEAAGKAIVQDGGEAFYESASERISINGEPRLVESKPLLFAHVTNAPGFDTRIEISNTTEDWLGTEPASGACRIDYFGENAPAAQTSAEIDGGEQLVFTLSEGNSAMGIAGAPGFTGYVTAACDFPLARGFAKVTQYLDPNQPAGDSAAIAGFGLDAEPLEVPLVGGLTLEGAEQAAPATALQLPHANTRGTYETWLAVANTSLDALGATPQSGSCILSYHGDGGSPAMAPQTLALAAGETAAFPLSLGAAEYTVAGADEFRGYLSIACDFERARAVALVTSKTGAETEASFAEQGELLSLSRDTTPTPVLYPFVTNQGGEDRVVVLVNSSVDTFGSTPTGGACTLAYEGTALGGAPGPGPAAVPLDAGGTRSFLLSRGAPAAGIPPAPGFEGFLYSNCSMGLARGVDYRVEGAAALAPYCELDETSGVQPADIAALTNLLGQPAPLGDPADPDGDGVVAAADVQYCETLLDELEPTGADLRVEVDAMPEAARPRQSLRFRVQVMNQGPETAEDVVVVVNLPSELLPSLSNDPGCTAEGTEWTCALGSLAADDSVTLRFAGRVSATASSELTAHAQVSSSVSDPHIGNNSGSFTAPLDSQVDISAGGYVLPEGLAAGETGRLTVRVSNRGPGLAEDVRLVAQIASQIELLEVPAGCTLSRQTLECDPEILPSGRTQAYLIPIRIAAGASGTLFTTITGSSSSSDFRPENNSSTLETEVGGGL